jgi:hypothetical protein
VIWLLLAPLAFAQVSCSAPVSCSVSITLTAQVSPSYGNNLKSKLPPEEPPPPVLVNRLREPIERYRDAENRRARWRPDPTSVIDRT